MLATEDILSEEVGKRLIAELGNNYSVSQTFRRHGNAYLRQKISSFCEIAGWTPVLLITDLDAVECPTSLINSWLGGKERPEQLVFRVAVREIESWLLADHEALYHLLGSKDLRIVENPDSVADPKRKLLQYASKAPRKVREDLLPTKNAIALIGLGYNRRMTGFVRDVWDPVRAASRSTSLRRARDRLRDLCAKL